MPAELATSLTVSEADRLLQAEALVRTYCGWHIAPSRTENVTLSASNTSLLLLPSLHVTALSAVTEDGTSVAVDDYEWSPAGVITRTSAWSTTPIVVSLTHGYASVPAEVAGVVVAVAQRAVDNPSSRTRRQVGPFADSYSQVGDETPALVLLDAEKSALSHYKLPPRA